MDKIKKLAIKATVVECMLKGFIFSIPACVYTAVEGGGAIKIISLFLLAILLYGIFEFFMTFYPNIKAYGKLKEKYGNAFTDTIAIELEKNSMYQLLQKNWFHLKYKKDEKVRPIVD